MGLYTGTTGTDRFIGQDGIQDSFRFAASDLGTGDRIHGGSGGPDNFRLTTGGTVTAELMDQITGVEWIYLSAAGNRITLSDRFANYAGAGGLVNVFGGDGADVVDASAFTSARTLSIEAGAGNDVVLGGAGDDHLDGNAGADRLLTGDGDNYANGGLGNDFVMGGRGHDILFGGDGDDFIIDVLDGEDLLYGHTGADTLAVERTQATMAGEFYIEGARGNDRVSFIGNPLNDIEAELMGGPGRDVVVAMHASLVRASGGADDDILRLNDVLAGSAWGREGDDYIAISNGGRLRVFGHEGDDVIRLTHVATVQVDGGDGLDTVDYLQQSGRVGIDLLTADNSGAATGHSLISIERFRLTNYGDSFVGSSADERVYGYGGNDKIDGGGGSDLLIGGSGHDQLTGGAGADRFKFMAATDSLDNAQRDTITDFQRGQDRIDLSPIDPLSSTGQFTFVGDSAFSGNAGELRASVEGAVTIVSGDLDGDGFADFSIALLGMIDLHAADFVL